MSSPSFSTVVLDSLGAVAEHQALCGSGCDIVATGGHFGSAAVLVVGNIGRDDEPDRDRLCNRCVAVLRNLFGYCRVHIVAVVIEPLVVSHFDCHIAHETAFERIGFCRVVIAVVAQDAELAHIEDDVRSEAVADFFGSLRAVDILDGIVALRTGERRVSST